MLAPAFAPDPELKSPPDYPGSPLSQATKQPLMLGLFLNLQDIRITDLPTNNSWTFDYNAEIMQQGEALGFELAFSRTQWLPKGGYDGEASLDAFVALGAMAAITRTILLISTVHVLYGPRHPLHFAKFGATLDHISKGRWGVNIMTGHRAIEHEMFGWQRIEHDKRYAMAAEFFDVVERLRAETGNDSYEGRLSPWRLSNAYVTPKPLYGRPVLVNATGSPAGIEFASRYSDIVFITSAGGAHIESALETLPPDTARIRDAARAVGRRVKTLINPLIVSRDTEKETAAYLNAILANKPAPGGNQFGSHTYDSDAHAWKGRLDRAQKQGFGLGGNIEIIGTPEQAVEQLIKLRKAGIDGVQLGFADWINLGATDENGETVGALVPTAAEGVEVIDDWDGFGRALSASGTALFKDVLIEDRCVNPPGGRFKYVNGFFQLVHLATLAGIGRAAAIDVAALVAERTRVYGHGSSSRVSQDPQILQVVGRVRGSAYAAGAIVAKAVEALQRAHEAHFSGDSEAEGQADAIADLEVCQSVTAVTSLVLEASTLLFDALGASAAKKRHGLDRHWRNARTIASHNPRIYRDRIVGDFAVNGRRPPTRYGVAQAVIETAPAAP